MADMLKLIPECVDIKYMKTNKHSHKPTYATWDSAGADLYANLYDQDNPVDAIEIQPNETVFISTGIHVEIPERCVGLIFPRSGLACKKGLTLANSVGVIDSDYRGLVKVAIHNNSNKVQTIEHNTRIAQLIIMPYLFGNFEHTLSLSITDRGDGGFGSTGVK